jgi:hypothetical protein
MPRLWSSQQDVLLFYGTPRARRSGTRGACRNLGCSEVKRTRSGIETDIPKLPHCVFIPDSPSSETHGKMN